MPASVGHPRKYYSQDEQHQAHAESSAKSYARHKSRINKRHQRKYQAAHPLFQTLAGFRSSGISEYFTAETSNTEFMTLVDRLPRTYAEGLYLGFMKTVTRKVPRGDDDELCQELLKIGELIKEVTTFEDRILNAAGIGDDLGEVQKIREGIQDVEQWLEDILCGTLEGVDILMKAYNNQTLLYQCIAK
ncbi:hypothetical protein EDD18DRAFT_1107688 [Armillaria luteobubalina]|uniref:Uncharacterized protein n=1 Tax=Armillaria luteobubalina TaxID=153913 RepID=A0AA39PZY6_9AGAR|nr:hypothetical protein EDD18DRAFT_1107688 [Armillaria luteobubalina]